MQGASFVAYGGKLPENEINTEKQSQSTRMESEGGQRVGGKREREGGERESDDIV